MTEHEAILRYLPEGDRHNPRKIPGLVLRVAKAAHQACIKSRSLACLRMACTAGCVLANSMSFS